MSFDIKLENTRERLREWGDWTRAILAMGLYFSKKSMIGEILDSKGMVIASTGKTLAPKNELAEEIDFLIEELGKIMPKEVKVLKIHYVYEGYLKEKIRMSGIPKSTYYHYLEISESWLTKRLNSN